MVRSLHMYWTAILFSLSVFMVCGQVWARGKVEVKSNNRLLTVQQDGMSNECLLSTGTKPVEIKIYGPGYLVLWNWQMVGTRPEKTKLLIFEDGDLLKRIFLPARKPKGSFQEFDHPRPGPQVEFLLEVPPGVHEYKFKPLPKSRSVCLGFSLRLRGPGPAQDSTTGKSAGDLPAAPLVPVVPLVPVEQPEDEKELSDELEKPPARPPRTLVKKKLASRMPDLPGEDSEEAGEPAPAGSGITKLETAPVVQGDFEFGASLGVMVPNGYVNPSADIGIEAGIILPFYRKTMSLFAGLRYRRLAVQSAVREPRPVGYELTMNSLPLLGGLKVRIPTGTPLLLQAAAAAGYAWAWAASETSTGLLTGTGGGPCYALSFGAGVPLWIGRLSMVLGYYISKADASPVCKGCDVGGLSIALDYTTDL